jgi:hypothetical protein
MTLVSYVLLHYIVEYNAELFVIVFVQLYLFCKKNLTKKKFQLVRQYKNECIIQVSLKKKTTP